MKQYLLEEEYILVHKQAVHQSAGTVEDRAHGSDEWKEVVVQDECLAERFVEAGDGLWTEIYIEPKPVDKFSDFKILPACLDGRNTVLYSILGIFFYLSHQQLLPPASLQIQRPFQLFGVRPADNCRRLRQQQDIKQEVRFMQ